MFENLRKAFRDAVDNFNREMSREGVSDTVDGLFKGMEREAVATKAGLESLKEQLATARRRITEEEKEAGVCRRREELARKIGDSETGDIAAKFAEKHENRRQVLSDKATAIEAEVRLAEAEYGDMLEQIKKARASRESLKATAGRTRARSSIQGSDDLFGELDRMADRIEGNEADTDAADELFDDAGDFDHELRRARREEVADARLEELKRRMGRK
ncbi:MAG: hypothetical protein F4187_00260 [Gemmatimonadetes bacterium]|nr:hypothetical protein [Gemmatimonadota bacterium]